MNLNETQNKRFICTFNVFRNYYYLERENKKYYINSDIDNFISENELVELYKVEDKYITDFGVGSNQNKPIFYLNNSIYTLPSYTNTDIYFICLENREGKVIYNYIYYVDIRIGRGHNHFTKSDVTSVIYYSGNSSKLVSMTTDDSKGTTLKVYGLSFNKILKYYDKIVGKLNSTTSSSPSSIGYNLYFDDENNLGINVSDDTNLYKFVIEEDYNEDIDGDIKIEESSNRSVSNIQIADDNYQPIGTIIALFKYSDKINSSIKNNYLKMDGSEIPDKPIYKNIRKLLSRSDSDLTPNISNILYNSVDKPSTTLAYKFTKFFESLGYDLNNEFPVLILTKDVFLKILSEISFTDTNGNSFKGKNANVEYIDNISILFPEVNTASNYMSRQNSSMPSSTSDSVSFPTSYITDNYKQRTSGMTTLVHDYNVGGRMSLFVSDSELRIGVSRQGTTDRCVNMIVEKYNSTNTRCANLIYVELFNRTDSRDIIDQYVIFAPYRVYGQAKAKIIANELKEMGYNVIVPENMSVNSNFWGLNAYEFDLYSINGKSHSYTSLFFSIDGICPNYTRASNNNNGTTVYNTYFTPIASYAYKKSPMSLLDMTFKNYKYYSAYRNFIYNQSSNNYDMNGNDDYRGHFIRYKIDTSGFSRFMKFKCRENDFGDFLDKLIDSCDYKGWKKSSDNMCFPQIGGIGSTSLSSLPTGSTSISSGMTNRYGFAPAQNVKGATYLFSMTDYNKPRLMDRPDIIGYRQIFNLDASANVYVRPEDTQQNRNVLYGQNLMIYNNGTWKSPLHLLEAYDFKGTRIKTAGNSYNSTFLKYMVWNYANDDSGGIVRVRFFDKHTGEKYFDKLWIEFVSANSWYDNDMGNPSYPCDETSVGFGFDILDPTETIFDNWTSSNSNKDIVVVIDRIHDRNININTNSNTRKDPWDIFDLSYFVSYLANNKTLSFENYGFHNKIYLPDMTEEGIFLGGGNVAGTFRDWTIHDAKGYLSIGDGAYFWDSHGVFTTRSGSVYEDPGAGGSGSRYQHFALSGDSTYLRHTNDFEKMYPNHYVVEWYIKYK